MRQPDDDLLTASLEARGNPVAYGPSQDVRVAPRPGMRLLVLGAQGRLGRHLVDQALLHEHTVTTLSRRPLDLRHPWLRVVKGDVLDGDALDTAMRGQQAVLVALGDQGDGTDTSRLAEACTRVAQSMRCYSVHRVLWFVPPLDRRQAHQRLEILLSPPPPTGRKRFPPATAPLQWVMVQASALHDGPARKLYEVNTAPAPSERPISRADVADFMIGQLNEPRYAGNTVLLTEADLVPESP